MRPRKLEYTLNAASATGFVSGATGTGPFTTIAGNPTDGLAHKVTVVSTNDHTTWTFTVVGTDANGIAQTETFAGSNAGTATSVYYFKTVTSITLNKTLGANTVNIGWAAAATTPTFPVDSYPHDGPLVGVFRDGTTVTWTAQQTNTPIFSNPTTDDWYTLGTASSTTDIITQAGIGVTAVRVLVVSHTNGVLEMTVSQARR